MARSTSGRAYISLGSNLGDRAGNLLLGIRGMMEVGLPVARLSNIYESEPVETFAQPYFLNMVAEVGGGRLPEPEQMMTRLLRVEYRLGRRRESTKGPRVIDLDLLLFADHTSASELLTLPHPRMHLRRFVLQPLAELAPTLVHPTLQQTIATLLEKLDDQSEVRHWMPWAMKERGEREKG
ncbi:MAG TPA: 2-amino-4-hydroxy-6-hydroxymethyldihydropteridine diphosphokinase [Pyrinomonadaceae bacterium]|nr:2-amino-4-hydroxy-6-hydroxymethyldihydropteridine diphosphokinase [Pyrinomonadaceae bacterium]